MKREKKLWKKYPQLVFLIISSLGLYLPVYGSIVLDDGTPDLTNMINQNFTVSSGESVTTWSSTTENGGSFSKQGRYNGNILIETGGIWRPMDSAGAAKTYGTLEIENGGLLNLSYKYGENYPDNEWNSTGSQYAYSLAAKGTTILHNGSSIRLNLSGTSSYIGGGISFYNLVMPSDESTVDVNLQLRYNKNFGGIDWNSASGLYYSGELQGLINIYNLTSDVDKNLTFTPETYYMDSSLYKYKFTSYLNTEYKDSTTKYYNLDWTADRTALMSQGVYSAANAQLSMRNLWRIEDDLFWKRGEQLRSEERLGQSEGNDGAWAQVWRGKYDFDGVSGSKFGQTYNGIQTGYDKKWDGKHGGGNIYTGVFVSLLDSDANFHQHAVYDETNEVDYSGSKGDLKARGIGAYLTWNRDDGQYLDFIVRGSRLTNDYTFTDSDDQMYENNYSAWTYGTAFRYGWHKDMPSGWFVEPNTGLSWGRMKKYDYWQDNNMRYTQKEVDMLIGHLGLTAGRTFGSEEHRGTVYAKAAVNHDFKDGGKAYADAMYSYNDVSGDTKWKSGSSIDVDTLAGKDTWWEFTVGADMKTGKSQNAFLELTKTAGGKVNTDWQVNAGMSWRFNGPSSKQTPVYQAKNNISAPEKKAEYSLSEAGKYHTAGVSRLPGGGTSAYPAGETSAGSENQSSSAYTPSDSGNSQSDETGGYASSSSSVTGSKNGSYNIAPVVVEAARPQWEKKLSPGTVSVIHVPQYLGEMKTLPELLETVPGVYIQRLNGTGHTSNVRIRGASGTQTNIYLDGVLINSQSDAGVDLSTISIENVDHIEVYRGYVPARFSGAPLGGAINIVTKKPSKAGGSISYGMRSFGGYTGNLELTSPLGNGSLLMAVNRDQSDGDFSYNHGNYQSIPGVWKNTGRRHRQWNSYHNTDALLKWQDDHWFIKAAYKDDLTHFPNAAGSTWADAITPGNTFAGTYYNRYLETKKSELTLGRRQTSGHLEWGWKVYGSYQKKTAVGDQVNSLSPSSESTLINMIYRNKRYGASVDGTWKASDNHLLEFLFDVNRETMNVHSSGAQNWPNIDDSNLTQYSKMFKNHYQSDNYYFQMQDTVTLNRSGNLFFTPQFRAQKMTLGVGGGEDTKITSSLLPDFNSWKYSYGLALKKVQNEHWTFRGTYGTYYRYPNFYEIFGDGVNVHSPWEVPINFGNYDYSHMVEKGISWDLGANWTGKALGADSDITLTYFNRHAKHMQTYVVDYTGMGHYENLAAGKIQGIELENRMKWHRLTLQTAVTWQDSLITQSAPKSSIVGSAPDSVGNAFPWYPKWEANVRLEYLFPGDRLSAFVERHYTDQIGNFNGSNQMGTHSYYESLILTNIGAKYRFNNKVELTAGINDLFNKGPDQKWIMDRGINHYSHLHDYDIENVMYPQQGRTYYMTVKYSF